MAKFGEGHVSAMLRLGLKELRSLFYPGSNIANQTEYGIFGTQTPGEVARAREDHGGRDEEKTAGMSLLESRVQQIESRSMSNQHEQGLDR